MMRDFEEKEEKEEKQPPEVEDESDEKQPPEVEGEEKQPEKKVPKKSIAIPPRNPEENSILNYNKAQDAFDRA